MTLFIRADATTQMGTGHVMRCLALAQAWREKGGGVVFLSHCESQALQNRIIDEGFNLIPIKNPYPDPSDLIQTLQAFKGHGPCFKPSTLTWLVLDGYHFTQEYQKVVRSAGIRLLVIDDMNYLPHYHADILLNQNIHALDLRYQCDEDTAILLGSRYVLLRGEFLKFRDFKREIPAVAKNILITMGGSDPQNVTLKVIQAIKSMDAPRLAIKVIIGPSNPDSGAIRKAMLHALCPMLLVQNATNMGELMAWADIAVSGAGSTCWELAFMGVPSITVVLAENQEHVAAFLCEAGAVVNAGRSTPIETTGFVTQLKGVIEDQEARRLMSECGLDLVDGNGTRRLLLKMCNPDVNLREARTEDCHMIWEWANDPVARSLSFSSKPIPWAQHADWFSGRIAEPRCLHYISHDRSGTAVGQIRFDIDGERAVVSVTIAPNYRGQGYGRQVIRLGVGEVFNNTSLKSIYAYIKPDNESSLRAFVASGFGFEGVVEYGGNQALYCLLKREVC